MPQTYIKFDAYFAAGGNTFDTSYAYGNPNGACELNLGWWIRHRDIREQVVVIEKGANPPHGTPEGIIRELHAGLERMQLDYADIYLMHRDNLEVPVDELLDAMYELQSTDKCTIYGVSNWSLPRLQAAQAYATRSGKPFFAVLSNQFSLAEMLESPWPDILCVSANPPAFRAWLTDSQLPLLPWSSQARGFFTDRAGRDKLADAELPRCWYNQVNFARRDRAYALAAKRNVDPITIALAWVLQQPFPVFPLIGPRRENEIDSSVRALQVTLTSEEMRWLEEG
jgi:aryl-alcohol dehydrogenase-like predicted oxidoreductase